MLRYEVRGAQKSVQLFDFGKLQSWTAIVVVGALLRALLKLNKLNEVGLFQSLVLLNAFYNSKHIFFTQPEWHLEVGQTVTHGPRPSGCRPLG